jgi:membrane-associated protease RseP (regulator of RpoE activity)
MSEGPVPEAPRRKPWLQVYLFLATVGCVFYAGTQWSSEEHVPLWRGWTFAVPLLGILLCHEFGHYVFARRHRVDASLPYFIPLPFFFGTLGAVIAMRSRIKTRDALLDIGAAGPLAGIAIAIPVICIGLAHSPVQPIRPGGLLEGQALLYVLLKRIVLGRIPAGYDVYLHPTALAGWVGLLVTMLNLLPIGQLDGGHIAYALFGEKQDRYTRWFHFALVPLGLGISIWTALSRHLAGKPTVEVVKGGLQGLNWLVFAAALLLLRKFSGPKHPPTGPEPLSSGRRMVAWGCVLLFVLLFMPIPLQET